MEKYDIISVVGEGSYGLVMRCRHRESGQYVAIKKFLETEDDPTVRKMALREIRMLKKLRHENLVNMIEVFRRKKRFFLVFEYLEHTVLEELEARSGGLGFITSRKYIYQVLRALDFIHSHDVIHRDIKPENVLVSRLGVIKLCDFGFARPYLENETFTDYVATRWYRSPELLVGDRYGKEVDIWAVGCLYSEMMTGEPLFPGESDIDQLFQIVRILGKLTSRHQILIMRNAMFRGMKQEQNTSLTQMFPNWNRDSIDFLSQCLKMDGITRPDTSKLLKHDLFVRDNFLDNFLSELRAKLVQEMQVNPLLKRIPSYGSNSRRNSDEKKNAATTTTITTKKSSGDEQKRGKDNKSSKINNLSVLSTQLLQPNLVKQTAPLLEPDGTHLNKENNHLSGDSSSEKNKSNDIDTTSTNNNDENELNKMSLVTIKQRLNAANADESGNDGVDSLGNGANASKQQISINNLIFKENSKYSRVLSARMNKSNVLVSEKNPSINNGALASNHTTNHFDLNFQPPSPIPFQSLQPDASTNSIEVLHLQNKRLSPVTLITNSQNNSNNHLLLNGQNLPQYFNYRRNSNAIGAEQITLPKSNQFKQANQPSSQMPFNARTGVMTKRERDRSHQMLDVTLMPLNSTTLSSLLPNEMSSLHPPLLVKEPSPRILPPPQWLTGNLKITAQGKSTQIGNSNNTNNNNNGNSKRRITDWKSVGITNGNASIHKHTITHHEGNSNSNMSDLVLPNCPGATISPKKSNSNSLKKKLSTLANLPSDPNHSSQITPRNFSASSDHINET